jgi:Ca2+-binding EF-hand superfamily protein
MVTGILVIGIILALAITPKGSDTLDKAEDGVHGVITNTVLLSLTALVIIAVGFELGNHHLHHATEDVFQPVLHAINSELMSVGFLAVIFYFLIKFELLVKISRATICKSCDPCSNGDCNAAQNKIISGMSNDYYFPYAPLTNGQLNTRRRLEELDDETFMHHFMWAHGQASSPFPTASGTAEAADDRRLGSYPYVGEAVGYVAGKPARYVDRDSPDPITGELQWKPVKGAVQCTSSRRLEGETIDEHHERAWGTETWTRFNDARRRLGGSADPYYTCECKGCDIHMIKLFEKVHMGLFLCLCVYFARSVLLLYQTQRMAAKWKRTEVLIQTKGIKHVVQNYYDMHDHTVDHEGLDAVARAHATEDMEYVMLRGRFVKTGNGGKPLENDFSFAEYLSIMYAHAAAHVVHITPKAWLCLQGFFLAFWGAMHEAPKTRIRIFVLYEWIGLGFLALLTAKMKSIVEHLTPVWPEPTGKKYEVTDELMETLGKTKPAYLSGPYKGQQHRLFWFGNFGQGWGPDFLMQMIRVTLIVQIIFAVLMINAIPFAIDYDENFVVILCLMLIPILVTNYFLPPHLLKLYTLATSIELTKNPHAIEETIRTIKFAKSIRTIKLLKSLQSVAAMSKKAEPGTAPVELGEETEADLERKVQMREVFDMFDESGDGEVDMTEMSGLMSSIGVEFSDDDKKLLMRDFDKSGDGTISFDEFWQYMRQLSAPTDPVQVVTDVFSLIDKDGSGSITAEEFSAQMKKLPVEVSEQDIDALVREVDHSGDGEIDLHEFAAVIKKYQ